jgi:hypothetical protein
MSKKIDYDRIVRDSFLKAQKDLGLVKEATIEPPTLQTKKWGSKVHTEYKNLSTLLEPIRRKAGIGVNQPASISQAKNLISSLNELLGIKEEEYLGSKTGVTTVEKQKTPAASLQDIVSSLYLMRILVSVLNEQQANVAGRAFESLMAVLFLGNVSGEHKPIEDIITQANEYISLKAITTRGRVEGSIANLAKSLTASPNSEVFYLVAVKDQSEGATKINFYSFVVTIETFFLLTKPDLKLFKDESVELTDEGKAFLNSIYQIDPTANSSYDNAIEAIKNSGSLPMLSVNESAVAELSSVKDIDKFAAQYALDKALGQQTIPVDNIKGSPSQDKYIKILQNARQELLTQTEENLKAITDEQYSSAAAILGKTIPEFASGGAVATKQAFTKYMDDVVFGISGSSLGIFKSSKLKTLEKVIEEINFSELPVEKIEERIAAVRTFDKEKTTGALEAAFREELKDVITNHPELEQKYGTDLQDVYFRNFFAAYEDFGEKTVIRSEKTGKTVKPFYDLTALLDSEFEKRIDIYRKEYLQYKKSIISPFLPLLNYAKEVSAYIRKKGSEGNVKLNQSQFNSANQTLASQRKRFLEYLFGGGATGGKTGIFKNITVNRAKAGKFEYPLKDIAKMGIEIDDTYDTLFLDSRKLFESADLNAKKFNEFVEPFNRNAKALKEGWDQYIIEDNPEGLQTVSGSLNNIREHIKKFAKEGSESEFKKASELTEVLKLTKEAAIVMEMLKRMEE